MRLQHATGAVRLKPGDHVLLTFEDRHISMAEAESLTSQLEARFPGVRATVVAGAKAFVIGGEKIINDQA